MHSMSYVRLRIPPLLISNKGYICLIGLLMALLAILRRCLGLPFILSSMFGLHGPLIAHGASKRCVPLLKAVNQEGRVEGRKEGSEGKGFGPLGFRKRELSLTQRHSESNAATP